MTGVMKGHGVEGERWDTTGRGVAHWAGKWELR